MNFFNSNGKIATTKLRKDNWEKLYVKQKLCFYQHKKRKQVLVVVDMKTNNGYFKDKKQNKIISEWKRIVWM